MRFPAKFFRKYFLQNLSGQLLLKLARALPFQLGSFNQGPENIVFLWPKSKYHAFHLFSCKVIHSDEKYSVNSRIRNLLSSKE